MANLRQRVRERLGPADHRRIDWVLSLPFFAIQLSVLAIPVLGFGVREAIAAATTYLLGMFFITAGYHRYFAHRSFRTSRAGQFLLALGAVTTVQHGVLWWAGHHRVHHRHSDGPEDPHSPSHGWLWSHVGWFLCDRHDAAPLDRVHDLARYPELRWLERWYFVPPLALGLALAGAGGLRLAVGGFLLGVVLLHHATFAINSVAHLWGSRPFATGDRSRNNALLALLTFGEGWHNNHHHAPGSARQGFRWWQVDLTWYLLRLLQLLGLVWDLRPAPAAVPAQVRPAPRRRAGRGAAAAALILLLAPGAAAADERFVGTARLAGGRIAYVEEHEVRREAGRVVAAETLYLDAGGKAIARLRSDYARDPFAPDYRYEDLRTGEVEEVALLDGAVQLRAGERQRRLPLGSLPLAAGQGLDRLARARLPELLRGEVLRVSLALPSRLQAYDFRIRALPGSSKGDRVRVRIEPASFLLRLLAPSIEADYDRETGRLLHYRGVSNVAGPDGEVQEVEIEYRYPGVADGA